MRLTLGDKILIGFFVAVNALLFLKLGTGTTGDFAVVEVNQQVAARYPLAKNQVIEV